MTGRRSLTAGMAALMLVGLAPAAMAQGAEARAAWSGNYRYEWDGGRTAGGTGIVVTYNLTVSPQGCSLDITGFQTDEHILCEVGANADNLWIRFRSYADGRTVNRYNVARYKPGESLFRLRRMSQGAPVTEWQSMTPDEARPAPAVHFRKV